LGLDTLKNKKLLRAQHLPPCVSIPGNLLAWQFMYGEHDWRTPNTLTMALYRKQDLIAQLSDLNYDCPQSLLSAWSSVYVDLHAVGLMSEHAKIRRIS